MGNLIDRWIEDKYTGSSPDDDRFKDQRGEYHASSVSQCPRKWYWDFTREQEDEASVYFELGRVFEKIYGRALTWEFGDDRVKQDVRITIYLDDDISVVGESDWVVFEEDGRFDIDEVILKQDGTRQAVTNSGDILEYNSDIMKVIETKTTKKIEWRKKYGHKPQHLYQLQTYMWAMGVKGEIVYMTRNELDEMVFEFERDEQIEQDIEIRVRQQHNNLDSERVPDTDPITDRKCNYCEWKDSCQELGGSRWE